MLQTLKRLLGALITSLANARRSPLPTTDAGVTSLIDRAIASCGLPTDNDSLRQAVASTLLSLPQGASVISVNDLRNIINQARCKQAAYSEIERIRAVDKAAHETPIA